MSMKSLELLTELQKLPKLEDGTTWGTKDTIARIRAMDRDHFAIGVSLATEETLEALFHARNVPDEMVAQLREAHGRAFSDIAEGGKSVHEHYEEMMSKSPESLTGFVSNLKGKVAELRAVDQLNEQFPGYDFELASSATQRGWDLVGTSLEAPRIFVQSKFGSESYAGAVVEAMQENANYPFAVSSEIFKSVAESHPELVDRLIEIGSAADLAASIKDNLGTLAGNFGVDVPDSIGDALPYVGEVVLGLRLIWSIVNSERGLEGVDLTDRTKVHGIRTLALASKFGINQVCMIAGGVAGTLAGSIIPGVGNAVSGLGGTMAGIGGGMLLSRMLQPRIEEVAMKLVGGDADDMYYLMNKVEIDRIGESLAATQAA